VGEAKLEAWVSRAGYRALGGLVGVAGLNTLGVSQV
jgi:hypothetical protein